MEDFDNLIANTSANVTGVSSNAIAGALKAHGDDRDVDVIDTQSAPRLAPAANEGGLFQIETASGRTAAASPPAKGR